MSISWFIPQSIQLYRRGKDFLVLGFLLLISFSCDSRKIEKNKNQIADQLEPVNTITSIPEKTDTIGLKSSIIQMIETEVPLSASAKAKGVLSKIQRIKIYGSNEVFTMVEFEYPKESLVSFPWKYQVLLTEQRTKKKIFSGLKYELLEIFPTQLPFLLLLDVTAKGNGGHRIYQIKNNQLENIYNGYIDFQLKTYDKHEDLAVYRPNELKITIKDINGDLYQDLVFDGEVLYLKRKSPTGIWYDSEIVNSRRTSFSIENPAKILPIILEFIYNPKTGHFEPVENYHNKYELTTQ